MAAFLIRQRKTLSIAESCTGGLVSHRLTNIPGSSKFLKMGLIAYANETKIKLLKVSPRLLSVYGAVSASVALAMAKGARGIHKTDFGLAITGIAGPTGGTKRKPIGLVYIAIDSAKKSFCTKNLFKGNRFKIKSQAASRSLSLLLKTIHPRGG